MAIKAQSMKRLLWVWLLLLGCIGADAHTRTAILAPGFASLKIEGSGGAMSLPIMQLGQDEGPVLSFDELSASRRYLRARLVHCNADWEPSALADADFTDGFNSAEITDYGYSTATAMPYVNYCFRIGSDGLRPTASGNYLIIVSDADDASDAPLLQARFCVAAADASIDASVSPITDRGARGKWQQLEMSVSVPDGGGVDATRHVRTLVERVGDENATAAVEAHPSGMMPGRLSYEHRPELIFAGGNEWRRFETVDMPRPGMHVDSIRADGTTYHAYLTPDRRRDASPYDYTRTQQGRFVVRRGGASESDLAADYATVHFTLRMPRLIDAEVALDGEFAASFPADYLRMHYDSAAGAYRLALPLKQGSYNYRYVALPRGGSPEPSALEGNHYQTANIYLIKTFVRTPADRADRLVAVALVGSDPNYAAPALDGARGSAH